MVGVNGLKMISFDQAPMGHQRRKPTTVLGNLPALGQLEGIRSPGARTDPLPSGLQETMNASREWAAWAPGLVAAIKESLKIYLHQRDQCLVQRLNKMDLEEWKRHIRSQHMPYRRDCRRCLELAGVDSPHRRSHADSSAYVLSIDLVGPYPIGRDDGRGRKQKGKYIMVATVPLPLLERQEGSDEKKVEDVEAGKKAEELEEQEDQVPPDGHQPLPPGEDLLQEEPEEDLKLGPAEEEMAKSLNQAWMDHVAGLKGPAGLQNVTVTEILESRQIHHIIEATSRVYGRFKALGVPILRIHSDREKSFLSKQFQRWCADHCLYQTMTSVAELKVRSTRSNDG